MCGAGGGNRTPVPSLENLYTNRCTTPAIWYIIIPLAMQNKHHPKNLRPFLGQEVDPKDVLSSHIYGQAARGSHAIPKRSSAPHQHRDPRKYGDSMVGSLAQYRQKAPERPKDPAAAANSTDAPVVGNRPQSGTSQPGQTGANSTERRQHFIEPPKRGFHPYA